MSTGKGFFLGVGTVVVAMTVGFTGGYVLTSTDDANKAPATGYLKRADEPRPAVTEAHAEAPKPEVATVQAAADVAAPPKPEITPVIAAAPVKPEAKPAAKAETTGTVTASAKAEAPPPPAPSTPVVVKPAEAAAPPVTAPAAAVAAAPPAAAQPAPAREAGLDGSKIRSPDQADSARAERRAKAKKQMVARSRQNLNTAEIKRAIEADIRRRQLQATAGDRPDGSFQVLSRD